MAIFGSTSYNPPGIYTSVVFANTGAPLFQAARIPVVIGEGTQYFTQTNVELFRGSSSVADDQAVNENITNQVTGLTRNFQTTYFPVTDGTGKGITSNDPASVQVTSIDTNGNQIPVTVISLNGATGQFSTQTIVPTGFELFITYFFKRGDTFIANENEAAQIPAFATQTVVGAAAGSPPTVGSVTLSLANPGVLGNLVSLQFVAGPAVPDALAVTGAGTDEIIINTTSQASTPRTLTDLVSLINAGILTLDGGYLTAGSIAGNPLTTLIAGGAVLFAGGVGQSTNTTFQTKFGPITDGSNGGIVTTNPTLITVLVDGLPAVVSSLNGAQSQFTLAQPVAYGSTLTASYYYNTWANTFDLLPASNVQSIVEVGLGPNRSDFVEDVDFTLGVDADGNGTVIWGPAVNEAIGVSATGETANFTPQEIVASVVDEQVFLRPITGSVNGRNAVFILQDTPTDGTGQNKATNNPSLINVYVGEDPLEAFFAGPQTVLRLSGTAQQFTLQNPPASGNGVWASYYRNTLETHEYSVTVVNPGYGGLGSFIVTDELERIAPLATFVSGHVAQNAGFQATGIVYPNGTPDLQAQAGAAVDETVTLTFNNDGSATLIPATSAGVVIPGASGNLTFTAGIPGAGGNSVTIAVDVTTQYPQASAPVLVSGNAITIYANYNGTLATNAQIAAYFPSAETTTGGVITAHFTAGSPKVTAATALTGGANAVTVPVTHSYTVTSNNSVGGSGTAGSNIGYLDQTYEDLATGFRITVVNPADHASYGVLSIPEGYNFVPGDTLTFQVNVDAASGSHPAVRFCGTPGVAPAQFNNLICIPGLHLTVISNFQSTAGDSVILSTFRGSGAGPNVGEYYYVTFTTGKTAADYAIKVYNNPSDAYTAYGQPSTVNRLSLGIQFLTENGTQTFAAIQVPVVPGTNQAADSDFIAAIQSLAAALPGTDDQYVAGVIPLSTSTTVHQSLSRFLITQSAPTIQAFGIGFVGYDQFTTANEAVANAVALQNERMIAIGNAVAGVLITDPKTGVSVEYPVSGEFMAAGLAGLEFNPANDVATTLTNQQITGFSRLLIMYDIPTMNLMAASGLTVLLNNQGALKVRHYKTTDPTSTLTSEPTSVTSIDYLRESFESGMQQFIGRKLVTALVTDVQVQANSILNSWVQNNLGSGYMNLVVQPDASDPTTVDISVLVKPMFSLLYIPVTFTVTTSL
jgi:hypothetical protein